MCDKVTPRKEKEKQNGKTITLNQDEYEHVQWERAIHNWIEKCGLGDSKNIFFVSISTDTWVKIRVIFSRNFRSKFKKTSIREVL